MPVPHEKAPGKSWPVVYNQLHGAVLVEAWEQYHTYRMSLFKTLKHFIHL